MNDELIKEFARQAGFKVNWQHADVQAIKMAQYKEFAELIVEECVRHFNEDYQRDFDTNWREDLSKSIKQHFGVEE
jgi:hypothetical protein